MGRYAAIDIGTNSIKMYVGRTVHGHLSQLDDTLAITRLGEGLAASGELQESAIYRTVDALAEMIAHANSLGVEAISIVGTEALRRAENADEFVDLVKRRCKMKVDVISSDREAEYAVEAVRGALDLSRGSAVVFDIGGGSTEVIKLSDGRITEIDSLPIGSRLLTDEFALENRLDSGTVAALAERIRQAVGPFRGHADRLIGLGGTFTTLGAMDMGLKVYDAEQVNGHTLGRDDVEALFNRIAGRSLRERYHMAGLSPERADVMPAGAAIALELLTSHEAYETTVCSYGLRHGLFRKRFMTGI